MDWSVLLVFLPVMLLALVALRLGRLRQGWSLGRALAGVAAGARWQREAGGSAAA